MKDINVIKGAGRKRTAKISYSKYTVQRSTHTKKQCWPQVRVEKSESEFCRKKSLLVAFKRTAKKSYSKCTVQRSTQKNNVGLK